MPEVQPINGKEDRRLRPERLPGITCDIDQRTVQARLYKTVAADLLSDLGGIDYASAGQRELVKRISGLSVLCNRHEATILNGGQLTSEDQSAYIAALSAQRNCLHRLGLHRRKVEPNPPNGVRAALEIDQ